MNNLKKIREVYGATQESVAKAIGVNRVTLANWENGATKANYSNLEKLSIFYGIGPEYFYEKELDNKIESMVISTANKAKEIEKKSEGKRNKSDDFYKMFSRTTFDEAIRQYMFAMKMLLALSDNGNLDDLIKAQSINEKMDNRLKAIIDIRKQEENLKKSNKQETLQDLIDSFSKSE